jgi:hypothetical protein
MVARSALENILIVGRADRCVLICTETEKTVITDHAERMDVMRECGNER